MQQVHIHAIPNGVYSLQEFLDAPIADAIIASLKINRHSKEKRLKLFLIFYQDIDLVAQLVQQGHELSSINREEAAIAASNLLDQAYDIIIGEFNTEERTLLESLFDESAPQH